MKRNINRFSPIPLYYQIASDIKEYLINQGYKINEKIPSENTLSQMYNVSRVTLRQALSELEKDGIIKKIKGYGSILCGNPHPIFQTLQLPGFNKTYYEGDESTNIVIFTPKIIELKQVNPIPQINKALNIDEEEPLCYIKRIFYNKKISVGINNSWLALKKVPNIIEEGLINNRLSLTLSTRYNYNPNKINNTIESSILTPSEMTELDIKFTTPCLIISSISYLDGNKPLEYSKTIWLGDKIKFQTVSLKD